MVWMGFLRSNFKITPKGSSSQSMVPAQRQLALDAAKLAGSIVVFRKTRDFVVE